MTLTSGFIHVAAESAFSAVCRAHSCLVELDDFAITRISPALAQCWRRGRFDFGALVYDGEWRVPARIRSNGAGVPPEAWEYLRKRDGFLDLCVYPERGGGPAMSAPRQSAERMGG